jgi:hypothetical protein
VGRGVGTKGATAKGTLHGIRLWRLLLSPQGTYGLRILRQLRSDTHTDGECHLRP